MFEPDLVMTDGEALLVANGMPVGGDDPDKIVEAWNPYRTMFDVVWSGRRHVMMGASQIDRTATRTSPFIGDWQQPKAQLLGVRGAPGNTIQNTTSYWIPNALARGVRREGRRGVAARLRPRRRARRSGCGAPRAAPRRHQPRRARLRDGPTTACACVSVHPGVTVDDVVAATGFELAIDGDVAETRAPDRRGARGDRTASTRRACATRRCPS